MSKRGLFILMGESFRTGGHGSRIVGSDDAYHGQMHSAFCISSFINAMAKKYEYKMDTYIATYNTKFNDQLLFAYEQTLIGSDLYDDRIGTKALMENALQKINDISVYDFVFLLRIDIFIKADFHSIFNPEWDTIRFASITSLETAKIGIHPRVNPMMIYVPKKYYQHIVPHIDISCDSIWESLITNANLTLEDMDVMIPTYHNSDSENDFNPLYLIANRPQSDTWLSPDSVFDKLTFGTTN